MKNNLYSLLIGINNYPAPNYLSGCVGDAKKMEEYLTNLKSDKSNIIKPKLLTNKSASKDKIVAAIKKIVSNLKEEDTFLLYFSGHGTREITKGRFKEDHNGTLEAVVCHYEESVTDSYLLADKEIRYLLNLCKVNAHIIGVFDCCHAGDVMRMQVLKDSKKARRMAYKFPPRPYNQFIFHKKVTQKTFQEKWFDQVFPDKNTVTISACQSYESSWEDINGGVFTRNLIKVLKENNSFLNYNDIVKKIEVAIRNTTKEKQTPTISFQGSGKYNQLTSWLQLHGTNLVSGAAFLKYNPVEGWIYSKGKLVGLKKGNTITVRKTKNKNINLKLGKVKLNDASVQVPDSMKLNKRKTYPVIETSNYPKPKIFIEDLESEPSYVATIKQFLKVDKNINWTDQRETADFQINIFNQCIYFSFADDPYRPIHTQVDLLKLNPSKNIKQVLQKLVTEKGKTISKWSYYKSLEKHDGFVEIPIRIEISEHQKEDWIDVTNGIHKFTDINRVGSRNLLASKRFDIKITNLTDELLFITPICLFLAKLEISAEKFFEIGTLNLEGGKSKTFSTQRRIWLDEFQEIYNWREEKAYLKFLVNNNEDLATSLAEITQEGFQDPLTHTDFRDAIISTGDIKGGGGDDEIQEIDKWGVYSVELQLPNTSYSQVTGALRENIQDYKNNDLLRTFIERLYFDIPAASLNNEQINKEHNGNSEERSFGLWLVNTIDHGRRQRRLARLRQKFPKKKLVIAEGDSWFLYPIRVKDTIDYIMEEWPVKSLAWAGDTLENYKKSGELLKAVQEEAKLNKPMYVLISGGGNDIIGPELKFLLKKKVKSPASPSKYLNRKYKTQMNKLQKLYQYFFDTLSEEKFVEKIIVHGYDYIRTDHAKMVNKDGWVNKYMESVGIAKASERKKIIRYLINEFNKSLKDLAKQYPKVTYVDLRKSIDADEWYDEIHPDDRGFRKVADRFLEELNRNSI